MRKNILFLMFLGVTILMGCSQSSTKDENATEVTESVEKEQELATEAKDESKSAKEEAEATEESVDKLLEDI